MIISLILGRCCVLFLSSLLRGIRFFSSIHKRLKPDYKHQSLAKWMIISLILSRCGVLIISCSFLSAVRSLTSTHTGLEANYKHHGTGIYTFTRRRVNCFGSHFYRGSKPFSSHPRSDPNPGPGQMFSHNLKRR